MIASATSPPSASTEEKIFCFCRLCKRELPIENFRFRRKRLNERHNICNRCAVAAMRRYGAAKRDESIGRAIKKLADAPDRADLRLLAGLVEAIVRRVGGLDAFVDRLAHDITTAERRSQRLAGMHAVSRMISAVEQSRDKVNQRDISRVAETVRALSDKQLAVLAKLAASRSL